MAALHQVAIAVVLWAAMASPLSASPLAEWARPETVPYPADNAWSAEREALGQRLFFDPRLSGSGLLSCASCHNPAFAWSDAMPLAKGDRMATLGRRTPTILNLAWAPALFWDGRAQTLEEQALGPIAAPGEMNLPLDHMLARLDGIAGYAPLFAAAYPGEVISAPLVAKAIATFERGVVSAESPFDRHVAGDADAMSASAQRGFALFRGEAKCASCHAGWRFTDDSFHDIGVVGDDLGRAQMLPGIESMKHAFKTPTLRSVELRAPYMHNGSEATLADVVELYDRGRRERRASLSGEIVPLGLSADEKRDLIAFMKALTSADPPASIPSLPR